MGHYAGNQPTRGMPEHPSQSQQRSLFPIEGDAETSSAHQIKPSQPTAFHRLPGSSREQQNKRGSGWETTAHITNTKQTTQTRGKTQEINQRRPSSSMPDKREEWPELRRGTKPEAA